MDRSNKKNSKILYKCVTANTSVIWQHALHIPPTNCLLLTAKQRETETETERGREADRQTERHRDTERDRQSTN